MDKAWEDFFENVEASSDLAGKTGLCELISDTIRLFIKLGRPDAAAAIGKAAVLCLAYEKGGN